MAILHVFHASSARLLRVFCRVFHELMVISERLPRNGPSDLFIWDFCVKLHYVLKMELYTPTAFPNCSSTRLTVTICPKNQTKAKTHPQMSLKLAVCPFPPSPPNPMLRRLWLDQKNLGHHERALHINIGFLGEGGEAFAQTACIHARAVYFSGHIVTVNRLRFNVFVVSFAR